MLTVSTITVVCYVMSLRWVLYFNITLKSVAVTTAWRVLRLQMEERPPNMEGSCEYAVADSRQGVVLQLGGWARC